MLAVNNPSGDLVPCKAVDELEDHMLDLPQVECPVAHHFGPGVYIREVTLPAGALAVGHAQRYEQLNVMLTGKVAVLGDDGAVRMLQAPMIFVGPPGRKVGVVIETTTWLNIYATEERDIDKLEEMFLDKSEGWESKSQTKFEQEMESRQQDRDDFFDLIHMAGFTPGVVRAQSENPDDQIPMPDGLGSKVTIRPSPIEGRGVFLSLPASAGELIGPARINGLRTPIGRFTNHSKTPNAEYQRTENGDIFMVAIKDISGCRGGDQGEEVTVDYRQALALSGVRLGEKS